MDRRSLTRTMTTGGNQGWEPIRNKSIHTSESLKYSRIGCCTSRRGENKMIGQIRFKEQVLSPRLSQSGICPALTPGQVYSLRRLNMKGS